jgi:site-specific DNA recombinase
LTIAAPALRCAIYARALGATPFRSLARQRALCRAYISRRRHERWIALPGRFEDHSPASALHDLPALQRLLAQIEQRRIDRVVIDRLSRICIVAGDLSRLMMILDHGGCSLVVAKQGIDGATPAGRQLLVTVNAIASVIGSPDKIMGPRLGDQQKVLAALRRLQTVQAIHAPSASPNE